MAQWGRNDQAVTANDVTTVETSNGAPIGTYALVKGDQVGRVDGANAHFGNTSPGSRANTDFNMFGNTTVGAFIPGMAVGVFGVDATEAVAVVGGPIAEAYTTFAGSGYGANAAVTITVTNGGTSGVVNAHANSSGRIDSILIETAGSGYITNPTITVAAPAAVTFNGNTAVSNTTEAITISSANSKFLVGDAVTYTVATGNTSILDGNTGPISYSLYVVAANTTTIKVSTTKGGTAANLTSSPVLSETGHSVRGETATGYVVSGGNKGTGIAHAGWVIRREGTGGRAGRVQYETLVAMGSLGKQSAAYGTAATTADASDDTILPDA